jgi:hypothetical protein
MTWLKPTSFPRFHLWQFQQWMRGIPQISACPKPTIIVPVKSHENDVISVSIAEPTTIMTWWQ